MKLFYISKPGCHHITELMPGIKAIYQMEQEFYPYLSVEFLPHRDGNKETVILLTKDKIIKKEMSVSDKDADLNELRNLITDNLVWDENKNITDKNGCLTDFRKTGTFSVIQGWQNKKRSLINDRCCKTIKDIVADAVVRYKIMHPVYTLNTKDIQDKNLCKKNRYSECGNNYPPNTPTHDLCIDEVTWLCNNGYPNKKIMAANKLVADTRKEIYDYLIKNKMRVDKKKFDEIIDAGLFQDIGNRMGNKVYNYENVRDIVGLELDDEILLDSIYDGREHFRMSKKNKSKIAIILFVVIVLSLIILTISFIIIFRHNSQ